MKKLIIIISIFTLAVFSTSCKDELNLEMYLSQIRTVSYYAQGENYTVTVYGEERENPFISDGYVGTLKKIITVKLDDYKKSLDNASVIVSYGKTEISGKFDYSPLSGKYLTEIEVDSLPDSEEISVTVKNQGEETPLTLKKFSNNGVIGYKSALDCVSKSQRNEIRQMLSNNSTVEVRLRLITEGERGYYYVSITDKNSKTIAYLVDGSSGNILASKEL